MIDASKIKPGDKVTWGGSGTVERVFTPCGFDTPVLAITSDKCWGDGKNRSGHVPASEIVSHTPAPCDIKVGDDVTWGNGGTAWKVIGLHEGTAWVEHNGNYFTFSVGELRHA